MKLKMRVDVYRWIGYGNDQRQELSLRAGKIYDIIRQRTPGVATVMDEQSRVQLVILPFEARVVR